MRRHDLDAGRTGTCSTLAPFPYCVVTVPRQCRRPMAVRPITLHINSAVLECWSDASMIGRLCGSVRLASGSTFAAALVAVLLFFGLQPAGPALAASFEVTQTGDAADANVGD